MDCSVVRSSSVVDEVADVPQAAAGGCRTDSDLSGREKGLRMASVSVPSAGSVGHVRGKECQSRDSVIPVDVGSAFPLDVRLPQHCLPSVVAVQNVEAFRLAKGNTVNSVLSLSSSSSVKGITGPFNPKWKRSIHRNKFLREKEVCDAWDSAREMSKSGFVRSVSVVSVVAALPTCDLARDDSEDFIFPVGQSEVPGSSTDDEVDIALGVESGFPVFLYRLAIGSDSLVSWLNNVQTLTLNLPQSEIVSLGKLFRMGVVDIHG